MSCACVGAQRHAVRVNWVRATHQPVSGMAVAIASRYTVVTHCTPARETRNWRSRSLTATLSIVVSSKDARAPAATMPASLSSRRSSRLATVARLSGCAASVSLPGEAPAVSAPVILVNYTVQCTAVN